RDTKTREKNLEHALIRYNAVMTETSSHATIGSFAELHSVLQRYKVTGARWLFRGHASVVWKLVPKAGRMRWEADDVFILNTWRRRAIEFQALQPSTEWD